MELRTDGKRLATILLVCLLLLTTGSMVVAAQTPDAGEVIQAAYAAVAEKDIEIAMTYVADDMVLTLMPPPAGMDGVFVGKAAVREWWEVLAADNGRAEFSDVMVSGSRVTWRAKWYADTFDALGVGPAEFEGVGVAQNGLLQSATWIFTEEFLARFEHANQLAANEALAHRYLEEMWDNGNMEVADEILADDFVDHYPLFGNAPDKAGLMTDATSFHTDGAKNRVEDLLVTPETIVIRDTVLMPDANGNMQEALEAAIFLSVADGQITERRIAIFGLQPPPPPGANSTPVDTAAEGTYNISGPPLERATIPSGNGCLVNVVLPYEFSGALRGTAEVHLAVLGQGPCEEMGPGLFDETVAAKGTFTGTVDDKAGTFEFLYGFQGQANQPFNGFIQIIPNSGTGELEGIQGEFMATGDPLNGEPFVYAGHVSSLQPPPLPDANATPAESAAEGTYAISGPPLERTATPSDAACLINILLPYDFDGAMNGTAEVHLAILGKGPCEEMGPGVFDESIASKGTFTGTVEGKAGTFDFLYLLQSQAGEPFEGIISIVPGSGNGELEGIQGEFIASGILGSEERGIYAGNYFWAE